MKLFPEKVNLKERSFSYSKMNTLLFCVFTFRVDCEMYSFVENEKYLRLREDEQFVVPSKHYDLSVGFDKNVRCLVVALPDGR